MNKLSIIKSINSNSNLKFIEMNIIKINILEGTNELILKKNFDKIITNLNFYCFYSEKYSNFFLFDDNEIHLVKIIDKDYKILEDLKQNKIYGFLSFEKIYDNFNSFDLNQRTFIVFKILRNLQKFGIYKENLNDNKALLYMINSILKINQNQNQIFYEKDFYKNRNKIKEREREREIERQKDQNSSSDYKCLDDLFGFLELKNLIVENIIYLFNIFMKTHLINYLFENFKSYLLNYFDAIEKIRLYDKKILFNNIRKFNLNFNTYIDFFISKKMIELIDNIAFYAIINNNNYREKNESLPLSLSYPLTISYSNNSNNFLNKEREKLNKLSEEEKENKNKNNYLIKKHKGSNGNNNNNYYNSYPYLENIHILKEILKIEFGGHNNNNFFSNKTTYIIRRIYYSKIYINYINNLNENENYNENNNNNNENENNKSFSYFNLTEEEETEMNFYLSKKILKQIFPDSLERNNNFFADLLDFNILSKLFFKIKDFKKGIKCLIYEDMYQEIYEKIKLKNFDLKGMDKELLIKL